MDGGLWAIAGCMAVFFWLVWVEERRKRRQIRRELQHVPTAAIERMIAGGRG